MVEVISEFFDSLLGISLPSEVYNLLAFSLVSVLLGKFFTLIGVDSKIYSFTVKCCIIVLALLALPTISFNLGVG